MHGSYMCCLRKCGYRISPSWPPLSYEDVTSVSYSIPNTEHVKNVKVHPIPGHESPVEVQLYSFFNLGARCGWVVSATPRPLLPPGNTRYPSLRRLCGSQGRSGRVLNILPPQGFDPRTVQSVAGCTVRLDHVRML